MSQKHPTSIQASSLPTLSHLYKTLELKPASLDTPSPQPSASLNAKISLVQTSIVDLAVTSIVNAANNSLLGGGGVDGAIHSAAGISLVQECRTLGGCPTGSAKITSAHALPSKYIIHAVGPIYLCAKREQEDLPAELLTGCYRTSLQLAAEKGGSVAFSCISTGVYGYPSFEAAEIAAREVRRFLLEQEEKGEKGGLEKVVFCCFESKDVRAYKAWLPKIFPPAPSDLPDTTPEVPDKPAQPSATTSTSSNARKVFSSADPSPDDDTTTEDWETVEKPLEVSSAQISDLHDEGVKVEAGDASASLDEDPDANKDEKSGGKVRDAGGEKVDVKGEVKHGLLKDW